MFVAPEFEVVKFNVIDVITTSTEETIPEETVPAETTPEETIPAETIPEETTPTENMDDAPKASMLFSRKTVETNLKNKLRHHMIAEAAKIAPKEAKPTGRRVDDLYDRLNLLKH